MVSENAILQISYIGYQTQEIPTKGQTNIQITMKDDAQALDDVVVIGYGTTRKNEDVEPDLSLPYLRRIYLFNHPGIYRTFFKVGYPVCP